MRRHRLLAPVVAVLAVGLLLAGCGGGDDSVDTSSSATTRAETAGTTGGAGSPSTTTGGGTTAGTVAPDAAGVALDVVFLRGGKVATGHRRVAPTQAVARAALEQLFAGPDGTEQSAGFTTVLRPGTRVAGLDIADGTATVTLSPDLGRGDTDATLRQAEAQVVYTLTQFPTVRRVRFGTSGTPLTRDDFRDLTPLVFLESVAPGDTVSSPVTVAGESNTFEGTVRIKVVGADGRILADTFTTATSGSGTWGTFSAKVPFDRGANTTGKVVVFWDSPKDGSAQDVTEVPVTFSR